ncbi:MAG: EAL domain-containing protein [Acidimicrobiia bacterium]|nr:MAG: EAL domain-containing protein [Acidimicrobiia bacterium]
MNEPLAQGLDQQRLFDLVIAQDALLAVVDEDDLLVFGNAALWEFTGRTPDDGLGKPLGDVVEESVIPDAPPTLTALLTAARTRNRPTYAATRLVDDGGDHHTFDLAAHPDTDVVLVVATDVTERERAIGVLSEDQNLLESVMDSTAEAIVVCDLDGRITSVNEAAKHHFDRFTEAAWDGKLLIGFDGTGRVIPQRDLPLGRALRGEQVDSTAVLIESVDGMAEFEATARPLHDPFGNQVGAVSVWRDVTDLRSVQSSLSRTEQFLEAVLNASRDGIIAYSFETGDRFRNAVARRWNLERQAPLDAVINATGQATESPFGEGLRIEIDDEGERRHVVASAVMIEGEGERPVGAVEVARDVTELRSHMQQLEVVNAAFDATLAAIAITDLDGTIGWANRSFTSMTGFPGSVIAGKHLSVLDPRGSGGDWADIIDAATRGSWQGRLEIQALNRRPIAADASISLVKDQDDTPVNLIAVLEDVTSQIRTQERIRYLATHDDLTGLPNRRILRELLDFALARSRRSGDQMHLLFLDLDNFKNVNDTFGHPAGDQLIRKAGHRFKALLREADAVARLGGDEFAILTEATSDEEAEALAHRILAGLREPFDLVGSEVLISTSIGITSSQGEKAPDELLDEADVALYQAKDLGRNTFAWFNEEMGRRLRTNLQTAHELRTAIAEDEFVLLYQPQYHLPTGELTGVEALMRWNHPERGIIAPGTFIDVAEDHGLMRAIGQWVRTEAIAQAVRWDEQGLTVPTVSVNLSPTELRDPTFADQIIREVEALPIASHRLEFELTEAALLAADPRNREMLTALSAAGVRLAIDDFGTGYSSLLYLKQFEVNRIKIAQEFVTDLLVSQSSASIIDATIGLADGLGLDVIAEGIEEAEHARILLELGCEYGQGYFMCRPAPAEEIPDQMRAPQLLEL